MRGIVVWLVAPVLVVAITGGLVALIGVVWPSRKSAAVAVLRLLVQFVEAMRPGRVRGRRSSAAAMKARLRRHERRED